MNAEQVDNMTEKRSSGGPLKTISWTVLLVAAAVGLGILIHRGIESRMHAQTVLARETQESAVTVVNVIRPKAGAPADELVLPGNMEAFTDTPIYARIDGYLKTWTCDIGTRVKAGQLLATIEAPEVDQQLQQARAQLGTAEANFELARSTAERWQGLLKTEAVSPQETEEKTGDLAAKKAALGAARANVKRLEEEQSFEKVYAPFDGVITARNIDIGALINAGSNGPGRELFHMAAVRKMRVYVQVPQANSRTAVPGAPAELTLAEMPGRRFHARIARTANAIDVASRTLRVEVDVNNPDGTLLPGAFVEVHLKLPASVHSLTVPVKALLFRSEGASVAVVRDGRVAISPIVIGHDYGDSLEVRSGIEPDDQIIVNPPDSIAQGQSVQIAAANGAQQ